MLEVLNSALKERRVVKLPGPANKGKANGNTEANFGLLSSSSLNKVIPKIISKARKNKISEPATANSFTLIPIKLNICSPTKRKLASKYLLNTNYQFTLRSPSTVGARLSNL